MQAADGSAFNGLVVLPVKQDNLLSHQMSLFYIRLCTFWLLTILILSIDVSIINGQGNKLVRAISDSKENQHKNGTNTKTRDTDKY